MPLLGKPLTKLPVVFDKDCGYIPSLLNNAAWYIEKNIKTPELFQAQGDSARVNQLLHQMSSHQVVKMRNTNVHDVIESVKTFLVQLPEPLLSDEVCDELIKASETDNNNYSSILAKLKETQPSHFAILHFLMRLLGKVAHFTKYNNMDVRKLATIFVLDILKPLTLDDTTNQVPLSFPKDRMQRLPYLIMVIENLVRNISVFQRPRSPYASSKDNRGRGTERTPPKSSPPPSVASTNKSSSAPPYNVTRTKPKGTYSCGPTGVNWREMHGRFSAEALLVAQGKAVSPMHSTKKKQGAKSSGAGVGVAVRERNAKRSVSGSARSVSPQKSQLRRRSQGQGQTIRKGCLKHENSAKAKGIHPTRSSMDNEIKSISSVKSILKMNSAYSIAATESKVQKPTRKNDGKAPTEYKKQKLKSPTKSLLNKNSISSLRSRSLSEEINKTTTNESQRDKRSKSLSGPKKPKRKGNKLNSINCSLTPTRAVSEPWEEITPWTHATGNQDMGQDSEGLSLLVETIRHPRVLLYESGGGDRSTSTQCTIQPTIRLKEEVPQVSGASNPTRKHLQTPSTTLRTPPGPIDCALSKKELSTEGTTEANRKDKTETRENLILTRNTKSACRGMKDELKSAVGDTDSKKLFSFASTRECITCLEEPQPRCCQDEMSVTQYQPQGRHTPSPPPQRQPPAQLQQPLASHIQQQQQQQQQEIMRCQQLQEEEEQQQHQHTEYLLQCQEEIFWVRYDGDTYLTDASRRGFNIKEGMECPMLIHRERLQMCGNFQDDSSNQTDSILIQWIVDVSLVLTALFSVCLVLYVHQGHVGSL